MNSPALTQLIASGFTFTDGSHVRCDGKVEEPVVDVSSMTSGYFYHQQNRYWVVYLMAPGRPIMMHRYHCQSEDAAVDKLLEMADMYNELYKQRHPQD